MKYLFFINTPAQAYTWIPIIRELQSKGHEIRILARDYGSTLGLLKANGMKFDQFKPITRKYTRIFEIFIHLWKGLKLSRGFRTTVVIGFGVDAAFTAALLRKPCIIFTDNEPTHVQNVMASWFASVIITPDCFQRDIGKKQLRINGYKEFAYLHPDVFKPDPSIISGLDINKTGKYVILRFNSFDAVHDIGRRGFTSGDQLTLVNELGKYARVFISPEGNLPKELESYRLPIDDNQIHHALYYAQLLVTDTQTMATEAAILGTPVVRCNNFVGSHDMGNFIELEQKYDLIYCFNNSTKSINKAVELIKLPDLKETWGRKRQKLLNDKINLTRFMVGFIEDFPQSLKKCRDMRGQS